MAGEGAAKGSDGCDGSDPLLVQREYTRVEDNSQSGSTTSLAARSNTKKSELLPLPQLHHLIPDGEVTSIKINRPDPSEPLAISIVGGNETPLVRIFIQDIYREGAIARDGRLLPGDMILKVNGIDISNVPHCYAVSTLRQAGALLRLTVLREQRHRYRSNPPPPESLVLRDDGLQVALTKSCPSEQLGIKLVRRPDDHGVFVFHLLEGGVAARDGRLRASEEQVHFIVSRQTRLQSPDILQEGPWSLDGPPPYSPEDREPGLLDTCQKPACYEKTVTLMKEPHDSLGMTVAGGMASRGWDLPVYVTNVDPDGVVGQERSIRKAVANLKNASSPVVLRALEMRPPEDVPPPPSGNGSPPSPDDDYSPLWVSWLQVPRHLSCCKDIVLRRSTSGSLGFSIVGGHDEVNCNQSFFIRSIVEGTPAYNDGRIRCGDILLEVNGQSTWGMTHAMLVRLLKELRGRVTLTIVSWPGSLL
ncbi:E3 ubiquitin-protein ligase LNX-like [Scleropages formosus]|uniref:E3 ubiquitin-protein ligase LNX-like n=1 Tax=Scleropages formosus TaxID=113540 RepID=A0A0N8JVK4_SCLFO|nr:E3 ubiquitin-protein ligase LNX-like [Scleropages formosus]